MISLVLSLLLLSAAPVDGLVAEEEATESLVHGLFEFAEAGRSRDPERLSAFFAERLRALALPAPAREAPSSPHRLVESRAWPAGQPRSCSRAKAVAAWTRFLGRFAELEDLRWSVTSSEPGPEDGRRASFRFAAVGRAPEGRRLWLRGSGELSAKRDDDGRWRLLRLVFAEATATSARRELFSECSSAAGVARPGVALKDRTELLRSYGAAAADVDGDGDVDVFATAPDRGWLYLNQGDGTFREAAVEARIAAFARPFLQPLFLDHDGDGDLDLFLTAVGPQALFENRLVPDGELRFRDVSARAGVEVSCFGHSASAGDVDGDGRPDIHVNSYGDYPRVVPDSWDQASNGTPNLLFLNAGDGRFREAAAELGVADSRWSYASALVDVDGDGDLDLTVANDFGGAVGLFVNRGEVAEGPRFVDLAAERGLGGPTYGMGISYGDFDRDGDLDLHVTKMSAVAGERVLDRAAERLGARVASLRRLAGGNDLHANDGAGRFRRITESAGGLRAGWAWGGGFLDVDNDGWEDLYSPNGFLSGESPRDTRSLFWRQVVDARVEGGRPAGEFLAEQGGLFGKGHSFSGNERDLLVLNRGGGRFVDVSGVSGIDSPGDGRAAVFADFDDDGDVDVFLRAMHGPAHLLFRNEVGAELGRWVRVTLRGTDSGTDAFGAEVRLVSGGSVQVRVVDGGSGFLSQGDRRLLFGIGDAEEAEALEVRWPSGLRQSFPGPAAGTSWLLVEGEEAPRQVSESPARLGDPRRTAAP